MRLLLVEDEPQLRQQVCEFLQQQGWAVDVAADGEEGRYLGEEYNYDLAIIDLGLPKLDGIALIEALRAKERRYPVLILTARGNWQDKVLGLEAGADDYLVKPFHYEELKARVHALVRRASGQIKSKLSFSGIEIDTAAKTVSRHAQVIELTSYEYNTLEYLVLNHSEVISKTRLTEHLYEQDYDRDSNVIEVFVGRLRKKLDPDGSLSPIKTLRGQGYRWMLKADEA